MTTVTSAQLRAMARTARREIGIIKSGIEVWATALGAAAAEIDRLSGALFDAATALAANRQATGALADDAGGPKPATNAGGEP